jgi:penicillin-binding protein 1A
MGGTFMRRFWEEIKRLFRTYKQMPLQQQLLLGGAAAAGIFLALIIIIYIVLPIDIDRIDNSYQSTIFYDRDRREYTKLFLENRISVPLTKMPELLKKGIVDVEDTRFYEHHGIDLWGIGRAIFVNITGGRIKEGASTITQQLARNALLNQNRTFTRKFMEIIYAIKIEQYYTKDEILEHYLNQIYFGHGAYGVEAASRLLFGRSVSDLKSHQIALLIGLPKSPSGFSPYFKAKEARDRRTVVVGQMVHYKTITQRDADIFNARPLDIIPLAPAKRRAAYMVDYIVQTLIKKIDLTEEQLQTGGYRIYTTLDATAQQAAEDAVATLTGGKPDSLGVMQPQIALVAVDPRNGHIRAMIGGRDFANTQLNRSVDAYRQPGSAIKPFVYTAAIDTHKFTPATVVLDEAVSYPSYKGPWEPHNYDNKFRGDITVRHAIENSVNIIAIKVAEAVGPATVAEYAKKMGLKSLVFSGFQNDLNLASIALGGLTKGVTPLEMVSAYTPLANQGIYSEPIAILEVRDPDGNIIYEDRPHQKVVLSVETAYVITDLLRGVIIRGTGAGAAIDRPAAGKTGTSSDYTNAWFVGYTPDLAAAVWIGNDEQKIPVRINNQVLGSGRAAQIWGAFMRRALSRTPPSDFIMPPGIISGIEICTQSGELATPNCPEIYYELFLPGTAPVQNCHLHGDGLSSDPEDSTTKPTASGILWGNPNPTPIPRGSGGDTIKRRTVKVRICSESGLLAGPYCPEYVVSVESFAAGEEPTTRCNIHRK